MVNEATPLTVLIVDDNTVNLNVLSKLLEYNNIHHNIALNGEAAIQSIKEHKPDLILLDIIMPEMDGFEVCTILKSDENLKDIPIIFITADSNPDSILKGLKLGAVDYITKPIKTHELILKIKTHLELCHTKRMLEYHIKKQDELIATKDKLFSIISHDLRNPLSAVTSFSEILITQFNLMDDAKKMELLSLLNFSSNNCLSLITNLLEWAKSQRGALTPNFKNYEIKHIIEQTKLDLMLSLNAKQINLKINAAENQTIKTDKDILQTILRNLITNAIKYSHENSDIELSVEKAEDSTLFKVKDFGVGMTQEKISKLFKIGERGVSTEGTKAEAGTGLGLIVSQEFANILGGKIDVNSKVGVGTEFILYH